MQNHVNSMRHARKNAIKKPKGMHIETENDIAIRRDNDYGGYR